MANQLPVDLYGKPGQFKDQNGKAAAAQLDSSDNQFSTRTLSKIITPVNAYTITDTNAHFVTVTGFIDGLSNVWIAVTNSLDQAVSVGLQMGGQGFVAAVSIPTGNAIRFIAPFGTVEVAMAAIKAQLQGPLLASTLGLIVTLQCTAAPTTGSVTVQMWGNY